MATLRVDHPDIDKFIEHKKNDDKLLNTNISVMVTDEFMQKVKAGEKEAKERWEKIVHNAWKRGDPGLVFIDTVNKNTNRIKGLKYEGVNACVTGDTKILTDKGNIPISELVGEKVNVWNGEEWSEVEPRVTGIWKPMLQVECHTGDTLTCTHYHKFVVGKENPTIVEAKDLKIGDVVPTVSNNITFDITYTTITSILPAGVADKVYCFNEPKLHRGVFNGILTSQCSELALFPYESCLIGSINFSTLNPAKPLKELKERVRLAVRCLDNVIDKAWYPDKRIEEAAKRFRRIAVGFTGLADYLIKAGLRYGSTDAIAEIDRLLAAMEYAAFDESTKLATEKGTFPEFENIVWGAHMELKECTPIRNIETTVVAPAGSTSILCNADGSGCEPLFALAYDRMMRREKEEWYTVVPDIVKYIFNKKGIDLTPERIKSIKENGGSVKGLDWVPEDVQYFLVTAQELTPDNHLDMLIAIQKRIGNSVSKTINLPNTATEKDISAIFMKAYDNNVKGITVFRDGCKSTQVLKVEKKEEKKDNFGVNDLPDSLPCVRIKIPTPSGSMYVMTSFFKNNPVEVFCNLGKSGMDDYAYTEAIGRLISLCLKKGIDYHNIVKTLKGIRGKDVSLFKNDYVYSVPDAVAIALNESVTNFTGLDIEKVKEDKLSKNLCPECNMPLQMEGKCPVCLNCGYNKCS